MLTFGVALPSFITAFTIAASLEYAGKQRGSKGWFGWMKKLPYLDSNNYLFGYLICGLILFIFGGLTGIVNASYQLNNMVHNTAWLPGHFHMTVAGPVFLGIHRHEPLFGFKTKRKKGLSATCKCGGSLFVADRRFDIFYRFDVGRIDR
jgi:heme/copper-type cytochrome/quinol oxidase subunit 1